MTFTKNSRRTSITSNENLLIFADKTTNLYETTPEQYEIILTNNVRNIY